MDQDVQPVSRVREHLRRQTWGFMAAASVALTLAVVTVVSFGGGSSPASASPTVLKALRLVAAGQVTPFSRAQDSIATCMHTRGQPYTIETLPADPAPDGYGLATAPDLADVQGLDSNGLPTPAPPDPQGLSTMTPTQQTAFNAALRGTSTEAVKDPNSCAGSAWNAIAIPAQAALTEIGPDLVAAGQRYNADPNLASINQRWSACMTTAGYPNFISPDDARAQLEGQASNEADRTAAATTERAIAAADASCQSPQKIGVAPRSLNVDPSASYGEMRTAIVNQYLAPVAAAHPAAVNTLGGLS